MKAIKDKIATNLAMAHYLVYCFSFMAYGMVITGLGPLIPYLSQYGGHAQTQYSFIFFCRSSGFMFGALCMRIIQRYMTFHQIMAMSSFMLLFILGSFSLVNDMNLQGIIMFSTSVFCCFLEVLVNVCVLETQKNGDLEFWMLICHGVFGIGGLLGPLLVYIFQIYSFMVMGLFIALMVPFYLKLKTPENHQKVVEKVQNESLLEELSNTGYEGQMPHVSNKIQQQANFKLIGKEIQYLTSFLFLLYIGLECSYGSWIASYAVLEDISTKQQATKYSSIFWISMTIFRFLSSCLPYKSMKKLLILVYAMAISSVLTIIFLLMGLQQFSCYFSAIFFGMCYSSIFPLLLAIPTEYQMSCNAKQNATFMIWASMGEGFLSMVIGYMMAWFTNNMLFYMLLVIAITFLIMCWSLKDYYEKQSLSNSIELKEVKKKKTPKIKQLSKANDRKREISQ